ncbi:hypothetical protein FB446DRAFT_724929 [Lentinula raphanica]|nr:hypothetical protein FB446DRAFT_724929 [Lentinula raphanica]
MSHLPQELIDRFIDEAQDSVNDLKVLSLVGRSWLHRARYHLFPSLVLIPQDLQAIRDHYADLQRRASLLYIIDRDDYLTRNDKDYMRSPLAGNPQSTQSFLSSITNTLPYVRGLRLASYVRIGRQVQPATEYFHRWLGHRGDYPTSHCRDRSSLLNEYFRERQKALWDAIDLPWGSGTGIHALPFRNLRSLVIHWSVFSWTPPPEHGQVVGLTNPNHWPAFQLAMLIQANADTLDHVSIRGYPGFRFKQYDSTLIEDILLDLITKSAPNLRSLSLGGLQDPYIPQIHASEPEESDDSLSGSRLLYPSGDEVPYAMLDDNSLPQTFTSPSLECLFIQGFTSESTILIEDAIFNHGVFSVRSPSYLGLSSMPQNYDYMFMFSKVQGNLTHLSLDLNDTTCNLNLKFCSFPKLESLQLLLHSTYLTWSNLHDMIESLSENVYHLDGSLPVVQEVKLLHVSLEGHSPIPSMESRSFLYHASVDELLEKLVCMPSELPESVGRTRVDKITMDLSENILADMLPITYGTGHLKEGKTNYWWYKPAYL